jgi:DNA repair protein RadC
MADDDDRNSADNAGHRERLRQRLLSAGGAALGDHELIEYLLMLAIPRRDTKPMAKTLLREFGGIGPLVAADPEAIQRAGGVGPSGAAAIKLLDAAMQRTLYGEVHKREILGNWQGLIDYLRASMAHRMNEQVRILHLDTKNQLLRDEVMSEGSIDETPIYIREVIRRALDFGSAAIIVVHNHPSGDPTPSAADIRVTRDLIAACKPLKIAVHDHIIVGRERQVSMKSQGLI